MNEQIKQGTDTVDTGDEGQNVISGDSKQVGSAFENSGVLDRQNEEAGATSARGEKETYRFDDVEHLHTLGGRALTGTSSVLDVLNKPLAYWAVGIALTKLGWLKPNERVNGKYIANKKEDRLEAVRKGQLITKQLNEEQMLNLMDEAYKAHAVEAKDSAVRGKERHALCEAYVRAWMAGKELPHHEAIKSFTDWAEANVERFLWSEMNVYSKEHWVGGISDCGAVLKDGKKVIIDFKSSKEAYHSQFLQIAGYDLQISENGGFTVKGERVMEPVTVDGYIVFPFGAQKPEPAYYWDTKTAKDVFLAVLKVYRFLPQ